MSSLGYFIDRDQDSHWYVVPREKEKEWNEWSSLDPEDEKSWEVPDFAKEIGGSPSLVTFFGHVIG